MKTIIWGIWNIRSQRFESEKGQVLMFFNRKDAEKKRDEVGRYAPDGRYLRRIMPIKLTPYDNKQIFRALEIKS